MSSDAIVPPIDDGYGYKVRGRDIRFLGLELARLNEWRNRDAPLGMSMRQYRGFVADLVEALERDGLAGVRCDVRLKGSAAEFFSGHHKRLPRTRSEIVDVFREVRGDRLPALWQVDEMEDRLTGKWINDDDWPTRRPFDSMYLIGIERDPSDVDLQISCDVILDRCVDAIEALGLAATDARVTHDVYNFVRKDLVERTCDSLFLFTLRMRDALGRHVSIAAFPSEGPPDTSAAVGRLSAHFRTTDWMIDVTQRAPTR